MHIAVSCQMPVCGLSREMDVIGSIAGQFDLDRAGLHRLLIDALPGSRREVVIPLGALSWGSDAEHRFERGIELDEFAVGPEGKKPDWRDVVRATQFCLCPQPLRT